MHNVSEKGQMNRRFHWPKTALLGLILGACLSACSTNLPEPRNDEPKAELMKPTTASDSTMRADDTLAPPKNVNAGG